MKRERKVKLAPTGLTVEKTNGEGKEVTFKLSAEDRLANRQKNVSFYACSRLIKAAKSVDVFGNCYGSKYEWTPEQIEKAENVLHKAVQQAIENIKIGKEIVAAGITL